MPRLATGEEVVHAIRAHHELAPYARMVGRWCWISFPTKPSQDTRTFLREIGFHWNEKRGAWQHPCGYHSGPAPYDSREKYQSTPLEDMAIA